jgi:hypothetical protein
MIRHRFGSAVLLGGFTAVLSTAIAGPVMASASYHNGKVLSSVQVVPVFWGPSVNSTVVNNIATFFKQVTNSPYLDSLDEYYSVLNQAISRGTVVQSTQTGGGWQITPTTYTGTQPTETQVGNELGFQINSGHIPFPTPNILYFVFFPPGYTITGPMCGTSCASGGGYCGCHIYTTQNFPFAGNIQFPFALMPDNGSSSGCNASNCGAPGLTQYQNLTVTASHELAEAITDPFGNGWTPEIGDSCQDNLYARVEVGKVVEDRSPGESERAPNLVVAHPVDVVKPGRLAEVIGHDRHHLAGQIAVDERRLAAVRDVHRFRLENDSWATPPRA